MRKTILALMLLCHAMLPVSTNLFADGDLDISWVWTRLGDEQAVIDSDNGGKCICENDPVYGDRPFRNISVEAAEFSPDDSTIISGAKFDGNMRQWDVATGNMLWDYKNCTDAFCEIEAVGYTKDGVYALFAGEEDGVGIHVRDAATGAWVNKLYVPGQGGMDCLRVSNDGTMAATAEGHGIIYVWDISDPDAANWPSSPIQTLNHDPTTTKGVNQVDWTPTDSHLISASKDGTVARFEVPAIKTDTWNMVMRYTGFVILGNDVSIKGVRVSNDLKYIAGAGKDNGSGRLAVWDYATGALVFNSTNPQASQYEAVEFTDV